nr:GGDEF domain-containing protein [Eubacterium sp.]
RCESYGIVMCDINGLKQANDTQGHLVGDMMIQDVARSLAALFGQEYVFRMGGDEFLVVCFDESKEEFENRVSKIKPLVEAKGDAVSIGMAYCAVRGMSFNSVMKLADTRMYEDKTQFYMTHGDRRR